MDKYRLYEAAVQTADQSVDLFLQFYEELFGRKPRVLREDFCGTFLVCCDWVKRDPSNVALGLDLDPEPLAYGRRHHLSSLSAEQRRRVHLLRQDVLSVTRPKADLQVAGNFSFFVFKQRTELLEYLSNAHRSLAPQGALVLELAGGPGFTGKLKESKACRAPGVGSFRYVWEQKEFDPISAEATYAIHFKPRGKKRLDNAFTYDWRVWTLREVREAMLEAGFDRTCVYWYEDVDREDITYRYVQRERGDNDHAWLAFAVGIKSGKRTKP